MVSNLWSKREYLANARFIMSVNITEYDMSKANISTLLYKNKITEEQYSYLFSLPKMQREISIGLMIKQNPSLWEDIESGIIEGKQKLFIANNILDNEVIRISNDAVYILRNSNLIYTKFGPLQFIPKSRYSMFVRLADLVIFFKNELGDIDIDVKGLGKEQIPLHENFMLTFIGNLLYLINTSPLKQSIEYFNEFYFKYLNRQLDVGFYRELNSGSMYTVNAPRGNGIFGFSEANDISKIDISYNAGILRELYGILSELNQRNMGR